MFSPRPFSITQDEKQTASTSSGSTPCRAIWVTLSSCHSRETICFIFYVSIVIQMKINFQEKIGNNYCAILLHYKNDVQYSFAIVNFEGNDLKRKALHKRPFLQP